MLIEFSWISGHMRLFENALKFGTRLYVGVCNDEDCEVYKRRPIMTHKVPLHRRWSLVPVIDNPRHGYVGTL